MAELEKFIETDADDGTVKLNGKNTFKKNQYVTEGNYAVDLANSDIWEANGIWFADTSNAINEGLMFPRSDGKWDSLSVLDGKIKLTTGITAGLGITTSGGTTQVIADYIVEEGTSGIWTYRKWNSGIAECWGTYNGTHAHYTTGFGGYGYNIGNINYPTNLFIDVPEQFASVRIGNGFGIYAGDVNTSTASTTRIYALASASGSQPVTAKIYAIGKWK